VRPATGRTLLVLTVAIAGGCGRGGGGDGGGPQGGPHAADTTAAAPTATPVRVARVRRQTMDLTITAPGHVAALKQDRVRAPYPGRLLTLRVVDGDRVAAGAVVAEVVSKNSEAAVQGAEAMLRSARSAPDSADARRALAVARSTLVRQPLHAPTAGVVLSHGAEEGDYLDEGEVLVTIAEAGTLYFEAQVTQDDLSEIRPGQSARIALPGAGPSPARGVVYGILPVASSQTLSAPVRIDFFRPRTELTLGLFGTATVIVGRRPDAIAVPAEAVLRDDVSGVSRVALVDSAGTARWVVVETGVRQGDDVQIVRPPPRLAPGQRVIVSGQVGLPEGAPVQVEP
jgi:RND family efflux transporter MFP subunit